MPGCNYKIFNIINLENGKRILNLARSYEKEVLNIHRFKSHLTFNHRLKEHHTLPFSLRFNPPIKSKEGYNIARRAGLAYLRLRITDCHKQIKMHSERRDDYLFKLNNSTTEDRLSMLVETVQHKADLQDSKINSSHEGKLQRILNLNKTVEPNVDVVKDKWVVNISNRVLTSIEKESLCFGFNFAITPNKLPIASFLSSIESGIRNIPQPSAEIIRATVSSILRNSPPGPDMNISKEHMKALHYLAKDSDITILPADKGKAVVVMNSSDYQAKINSLLEDNTTYKKITDRRRNPTSATEKTLNQLLKEIKNERSLYNPSRFQLNDPLFYKLRSTDAIPAKFYGLPKIHKDNNPLRPITSSTCCPTYELSKFLVKVLSPLQDYTRSIKNSTDFTNKITTQNIQPDEIFVSFDVISLFTSIPTSLALDVVSNKLTADTTLHRRTDISAENLLRLLELVLNNNFFIYQGVHYQQVFGCPMGSPISALLANLVMEYIETKAIDTAQHPPKWWFRYVDDVHACVAHAHLNDFHNHLNSINQHIQFTREEESGGSISFLDTRTIRNEDGSITVDVYRKNTHTNKYLNFKSHHPNQHKRSAAKSLLDRAKTIPTTEAAKKTETKYVKSVLRANDYPNHFIESCSQSQRSREINDNTNDKGFVVLPYLQGISDKIARVLRREHIKVAFKPIKTIGSILKKPKDKVPKEDNIGVVYEILCKQCDKLYIGQTSRSLSTRTKEHKRAVLTDDKLSLIAAHHRDTHHDFDFDNVKIIDRSMNWNQRTFLEAWHSINKPNSINEHIQIPQVYRLLQPLS